MAVMFDVAIVGGGIVGASIAYALAPRRRVLLLEAEASPGYHSSGRSAALYTDVYGPPGVCALTRASRSFFSAPPPGFAEALILRPRGSMTVATATQLPDLERFYTRFSDERRRLQQLGPAESLKYLPVLRPESTAAAVYDPDASDIDAALLLQGFIRGARARGATFALSSRITRISRGHFGWDLATDSDVHRAAYLVNAAGAWADAIAQMAGVGPIGLEPRRRTAFLFDPPVGAEITRWPAAIALDESWYFKPEARMLMGSPADAEIVSPHDVVAEDFDVAVAVDRIEAATTMSIGRPRHMWAGLRSFVADGEPVCGSDPSDPAFFWAAALGGYGIQSAPAVGALLASQLLDEAVPSMLGAEGFDVTLVSRARVGITGAPPDAGSAP